MQHWLDTYSVGAFNPFNPFDIAEMYKALKDPAAAQLPQYRMALNSYKEVMRLLRNAGVPERVAPWAAAQVVFETNGFKSRVSKQDFNLSGIKWINKPYQKATRGLKSTEGNYYAHFSSYNAWASDMKRILSIGGPNAPVNASDLKQYVDRLKANGYFTSNPDIYYRSLQLITSAAGQLVTAQDKELEKAKADQNKKSWFALHPVWTGVIVAVGAVVVIKAVNN